jgi:predicted dehydrogenase
MNVSRSHVLRTAIVGCGQIADAHLQELRKISGVEVVATCDVHSDLAMRAALQFDVPLYFHDLDLMLKEVRPDVVHLATPAHTHAALAKKILAAGAHVYVEKPFTVDCLEAEQVCLAASSQQRVVCLGHDQLFDPNWLELLRRVANNEIGTVRHVESILGYPLSGQFGSVVLADAKHWVRQLPGGLFQNTISHPLYRMTEFLVDERPEITARWWNKPGFDVPTEMFVHLRGQDVTGTLTFSTTIAAQRITRVTGSLGTLEVDFDANSVIRSAPPRLPGAFGKIDAPWRRRREAVRSLRRNVRRFIRSDIHYFAGMKTLFERFHQSIRDQRLEWPVKRSEIIRVTRLMDEIFAQCRAQAAATVRPDDRVKLAAWPTPTVVRSL